jgi:hypothetical protein
MIPKGKLPGNKCDICGHVYYRKNDGEFIAEGCSEFCNSLNEKQKQEFRSLLPGQFGLWPCFKCGCCVQGIYDPHGYCNNCKVKKRRSFFSYLKRCFFPIISEDLAKEIIKDMNK